MVTPPPGETLRSQHTIHLRSNGDNALLFQTVGLIDRGLGKSGTFTSPLLYSFKFHNHILEQQAFQSQSPYGVSGLGVVR